MCLRSHRPRGFWAALTRCGIEQRSASTAALAEDRTSPLTTMPTQANAHQPISRWQPGGMLYHLRNPRRFISAVMNAPVAVGFDRELPASTTSWTYSPESHDSRIVIRFRSESDLRHHAWRWRLLAQILHRHAMADRGLRIHEVLINLDDGVGEMPPDILAFARRRGSRSGLIPNPYLLQLNRRLPPPRPWERKTEMVYFRGASTGSIDYESNVRVALCKAAKPIRGSDCRISSLVQTDQGFSQRLKQDGLFGGSRPLGEMNRHRFLIDVDGNASSWDRYKFIGLFGGVPIRFECGFEECWHEFLTDGVNCIVADRNSLPHVVEHLRSRPNHAREIAMAAQRLVAEHLSPQRLRERLVRTISQMDRRY